MGERRKTLKRSFIFLCIPFLVVLLSGCSQDRNENPSASSDASETVRKEREREAHDEAAFFTVTISPGSPERNTPLRGQVSGARNIEEWSWYLNDQLLPAQGGPVLPQHDGIRGDRVTLVVVADGRESSDTVTIANSPPEIVDIGLRTNEVFRGMDISVFPEAVDPDGDPVEFRFIWYINGEEVIGQSTADLPGNLFRRGDTITLEVIPFDREAEGPPFLPEPLIIPNGPPRFVSQPPKEFSGFEYRYQLRAEDPDGDPLRFSLEEGPEGMTIDEMTGLLVWPISVSQGSENTVKVVVSDDQGLWASQEFILRIANN